MDKNDEVKMVEIARFTYPLEASTLIALLESEAIDCYLRDEIISGIMGVIDVGGNRLEVLESDLPRALEIMKEGGYERFISYDNLINPNITL
jgi:hypothetical protein